MQKGKGDASGMFGELLARVFGASGAEVSLQN